MTESQFRQLIHEEIQKALNSNPTIPTVNSIQESKPFVNPKLMNLNDNSKQEVIGDLVENVKLNSIICKKHK